MSKTIECLNCGRDIPENSRKCPYCKSSFEEVEVSESSKKVKINNEEVMQSEPNVLQNVLSVFNDNSSTLIRPEEKGMFVVQKYLEMARSIKLVYIVCTIIAAIVGIIGLFIEEIGILIFFGALFAFMAFLAKSYYAPMEYEWKAYVLKNEIEMNKSKK